MYLTVDNELDREVINKKVFTQPVLIESLELLVNNEQNFICRVRDTSGAIGYSVSNNMQMVSLYPIFTNRLQPFFVGKDARDLELLLDQVYVYKSNYKLQNLALWVPSSHYRVCHSGSSWQNCGKIHGRIAGRSSSK